MRIHGPYLHHLPGLFRVKTFFIADGGTESLDEIDERFRIIDLGRLAAWLVRKHRSAKEKWVEQIRSDVAGIVETDRGYQRIICITARFARAKARAALEDKLTAKYGIPITIYDRSWIVKEVIDSRFTETAPPCQKLQPALSETPNGGIFFVFVGGHLLCRAAAM
jgi:hypothetical protein